MWITLSERAGLNIPLTSPCARALSTLQNSVRWKQVCFSRIPRHRLLVDSPGTFCVGDLARSVRRCSPLPRSPHSSWGAPKIREKLRRLHGEIQLPAISTVHAVLDRHGLVTRGRRHEPLKADTA